MCYDITFMQVFLLILWGYIVITQLLCCVVSLSITVQSVQITMANCVILNLYDLL